MTSSVEARAGGVGGGGGMGSVGGVEGVDGAVQPAPAGAPAGGRLPDFFIVGHPKCGTTALYEMLRRHPQIYMPDLKEPAFFAGELPREAHRVSLPATLDQYLALFAPAPPRQRAGEASAIYLWSATAARRIAEAQPAARVVAILREPASFLRSLHLQNLRSRYETEGDLRSALALEHARREGRLLPRGCRRPQALLYSEYVRYTEQLRRYHGALGREQVLVLVYDDFRSDNVGTVRAVLRFVGVDDRVPVAAVEANPTVRTRARRLDDLLHTVSAGHGPVYGAVKRSLKAASSRRLRRGALAAIRRGVTTAPPPPVDEGLMLELRHRFKGEVEAVSDYLGRDLVALWGYDQLA